MRVLITGNMGFVGAETQKLLLEEKQEVIGFDIMALSDIRNYKHFENAIEQHHPNRILHLAAIARFSDADKDPKLAFETNVMGTMNVVRAAQKYAIPLIYASTGSVYMPVQTSPITEEHPTQGNSVYGCTKYMGELYVKEHTPHIILRYAHLYGKEKRGHGLVGGFVARIERGLSPTLYGGKQSNDFTYIKDVARANCIALTSSWDKWNQAYNIGTGEELKTVEAAEIICKIAGWKGQIERKAQREVDAERFVFDVSKAERMLNFKAQYSFEDGLKDMFSVPMMLP